MKPKFFAICLCLFFGACANFDKFEAITLIRPAVKHWLNAEVIAVTDVSTNKLFTEITALSCAQGKDQKYLFLVTVRDNKWNKKLTLQKVEPIFTEMLKCQ